MVDDEIRSEGSPSTITIDIPGEKPRTRPNSPELPVRSRPSSALHPETQPSKTLPESPAAYTPLIRPPPNTPATNAPARAAYAPALSPYEPALDVIVEAPAPAAPMPDPVHTAWKVAQIGMMLRKHKDSSALRYLQRSLHLDPAAGKVWRLLGHARAKDGQLQSACAAFRSAIVFDPETDLEARTALATLLAQMGKAAASADELLKVRSLDPNFGFVTEPLERLCRRLMPAQRFACIQSPERTRAWREALISMAQDARILDMSSTPLPALLAVCCAEAHRPVLHVSHLPQSIAMQLLNCNGSLHAIELLPAGSDGLPEHNPSAPLLVEGSTPNLLVVDSDAIDILASSFLTTVRSAKAMVHPKARVMPCTLEVHVALVESNDLMQMNAMTSEYSCGFDLSAVNAFSHRSRLVRLSQLSHRMLTRPSALIRIPLDGDELSENGDDVLDLKVELSGTAHAIVVWHTLWLTSCLLHLAGGPGRARLGRGGSELHTVPGSITACPGHRPRTRSSWRSVPHHWASPRPPHRLPTLRCAGCVPDTRAATVRGCCCYSCVPNHAAGTVRTRHIASLRSEYNRAELRCSAERLPLPDAQ